MFYKFSKSKLSYIILAIVTCGWTMATSLPVPNIPGQQPGMKKLYFSVNYITCNYN